MLEVVWGKRLDCLYIAWLAILQFFVFVAMGTMTKSIVLRFRSWAHICVLS